MIDSEETMPIAWHRRHNGEMAERFVCMALIDLFEAYGISERDALGRIRFVLGRITRDYYHLTPEDIKLFVERAISGDYGKCYGTLSPAVVLEWLGRYSSNRFDEIEGLAQARHYSLSDSGGNWSSTQASNELDRLLRGNRYNRV